jgi:hypothetical protein
MPGEGVADRTWTLRATAAWGVLEDPAAGLWQRSASSLEMARDPVAKGRNKIMRPISCAPSGLVRFLGGYS